jgi:hypothetical protein
VVYLLLARNFFIFFVVHDFGWSLSIQHQERLVVFYDFWSLSIQH